MSKDYAGINDEAAKFTSKEDEAARARDNAAVEMAKQIHEWSKDNLARFDNDGNQRVNFAELDLGNRKSASAEDQNALRYLQDHYKDIQHHSQNRFLFFKGAGGVSTDGVGEYLHQLEQQRDEHEKQLQSAIHERALQANSKELATTLLSNEAGNPNSSLFRVIDSTDGDINKSISKRDLNRYLNEYEKRSRYGDIGSGFFTPETRRYVEQLRDNWNSPEVVRLRGTWTKRDNDGREEQIPNDKISEESLKKAIGISKDSNLFTSFSSKQNSESDVQTFPVKFERIEERALPPVEMAATAESGKQAAKSPVEGSPRSQVGNPTEAKRAESKEASQAAAVREKPAEQTEKTTTVLRSGNGEPVSDSSNRPVLVQASGDKTAPSKKEQSPLPVIEAPPANTAVRQTIAKASETKAASASDTGAKQKAVVEAAVIEADDFHKLKSSPWKAEPASAVAKVIEQRADNYYSKERSIAAINMNAARQDSLAVADAMKLNEWGKDNLRRFDLSGDNRLNSGELDLGSRTTNGTDQNMLRSIQNKYAFLKEQTGDGFLSTHPDSISQKDLQVNLDKRKEEATAAELARQQASAERQQRFKDGQLISGLLATPNGNPNRSLFRVIDGIDNDISNEISRKDLNRYMDEYEKRSRFGDVGHGFFSQQMRAYVDYLHSNWDGPEIKRLRGSYRDSENREQSNRTISLERLRELVGLSKDQDIFQEFRVKTEQ